MGHTDECSVRQDERIRRRNPPQIKRDAVSRKSPERRTFQPCVEIQSVRHGGIRQIQIEYVGVTVLGLLSDHKRLIRRRPRA